MSGPRKASGWGSSKRITTPEFIRTRKLVRQRDPVCVRCYTLHGIITPGQACDHWLATAYGGTDDPYNAWMLCNPCHTEKTNYESKDRVGFPPTIDPKTGWDIEEPDWQEIIRKRQDDWVNNVSI